MSTYYVSSFNGNDANDGLSESSAILLSLRLGTRFCLKRTRYLNISISI